MCGRFANQLPSEFDDEFEGVLNGWPGDTATGYNVSPTQLVPIITQHQIQGMRWGMIAPWAKEISSKYPTHNARAETVGEKPTFRNAWKKAQTCLFPAMGYYEWTGSKGNKTRHLVHRQDHQPLLMGGLWDYNERLDSFSCTIITLPAFDELAELHPRMPMMVTASQAEKWLSGTQLLNEMQASPDTKDIAYQPVNNLIGDDGRGLSEHLLRSFT